MGAALLVLFAEPAMASCMPYVRWVNHETVDGYMTVEMGKTCRIGFRSAGPTYTIHILTRPSHGTLSTGSVGSLTYRPRPGFVGSDTFTYARRGLDKTNGPMDARIRVQVTVTQ